MAQLPFDVFGDGSCVEMWRLNRSLASETGTHDFSVRVGTEYYSSRALSNQWGFGFDGETGLRTTDSGLPTGSAPRAFSFWWKPSPHNFSANYVWVLNYGVSTSYQRWTIYMRNEGASGWSLVLGIYAANRAWILPEFLTGKAAHIVVQTTGTTVSSAEMWVNGVSLPVYTEINPSSTLNTSLNGDFDLGDAKFLTGTASTDLPGWFGNLRIFNRALSPAEIQTLMTERNGGGLL